ncbi:hypothetical protein BJ546DRAFT_210203 [Cryomyces antarcticus]
MRRQVGERRQRRSAIEEVKVSVWCRQGVCTEQRIGLSYRAMFDQLPRSEKTIARERRCSYCCSHPNLTTLRWSLYDAAAALPLFTTFWQSLCAFDNPRTTAFRLKACSSKCLFMLLFSPWRLKGALIPADKDTNEHENTRHPDLDAPMLARALAGPPQGTRVCHLLRVPAICETSDLLRSLDESD